MGPPRLNIYSNGIGSSLHSSSNSCSPMDISPPTTPNSEPVASGKENVGRWSDNEHQVFLQGLEKHGKQWKLIATMIGTRTVVQVRTHAQKYFQKMDRKSGDSSNIKSVPKATLQKRKSLPTVMPSNTSKKGRGSVANKPSKKSRSTSVSVTSPQYIASAMSNCPPSTLPYAVSYSSSTSFVNESMSTSSPNAVSDIDLQNFAYNNDNADCIDSALFLDCFDATKKGISSEDDDILSLFTSTENDHEATTPANVVPSQSVQIDSTETGTEVVQDPLEWLLDDGINHLPESSLEQQPQTHPHKVSDYDMYDDSMYQSADSDDVDNNVSTDSGDQSQEMDAAMWSQIDSEVGDNNNNVISGGTFITAESTANAQFQAV